MRPIKPLLWVRAESRAGEARAPLTPNDAGRLLADGFTVVVERSSQRSFSEGAYLARGCRLVPAGQWTEAPPEAFILGVKELPAAPAALRHRHIYFGHAYKDQPGADTLLRRFRRGGGQLLDLEYLCDDGGRRLAAFGYWAGYVGAALAILTWAGQQQGRAPPLSALSPWRDRDALMTLLREALAPVEAPPPTSLVIGSAGRCGSGARALLAALQFPCAAWDLPETRGGGPFPAILGFEALVNCVLLQSPPAPFLTTALLDQGSRQLRVIADVSCDPGSPHNPLPVYNRVTSLDQPLIRLRQAGPRQAGPRQAGPRQAGPPLDVIAIDHLPALLPLESSADFSAQLLPALIQLADFEQSPWGRTRDLFLQHCAQVEED